MSEGERDRGILSKADRNFLRASDGEYSRQATHERERAIEERVVNSLLDFEILFEHLTREERREIYEQLPEGERGSEILSAAMAILWEASGKLSLPFNALVERAIRNVIEQGSESAPPGQMLKVKTDFDVDIGYVPADGPEVNSAVRTLLGGGDFDDLDRDELVDYLRWSERAGSVAPEAVVRERRGFFEDTLDGPSPDDIDVDEE